MPIANDKNSRWPSGLAPRSNSDLNSDCNWSRIACWAGALGGGCRAAAGGVAAPPCEAGSGGGEATPGGGNSDAVLVAAAEPGKLAGTAWGLSAPGVDRGAGVAVDSAGTVGVVLTRPCLATAILPSIDGRDGMILRKSRPVSRYTAT